MVGLGTWEVLVESGEGRGQERLESGHGLRRHANRARLKRRELRALFQLLEVERIAAMKRGSEQTFKSGNVLCEFFIGRRDLRNPRLGVKASRLLVMRLPGPLVGPLSPLRLAGGSALEAFIGSLSGLKVPLATGHRLGESGPSLRHWRDP